MKASMGLNKFHQRTTASSNPISSKTARAVQAIREKVESSGLKSESKGSDGDLDRRRVRVQLHLTKQNRTRITAPGRRVLVERMITIAVEDRRRIPIGDLLDTMIEGDGRD